MECKHENASSHLGPGWQSQVAKHQCAQATVQAALSGCALWCSGAMDAAGWNGLVQQLLAVPLTFRQGDGECRRLDALSKELRLSEAYAAHPGLRKQVSRYGGLGRLWRFCHEHGKLLATHGGMDAELRSSRSSVGPEEKPDDNMIWQLLLHDLRQMASQDMQLHHHSMDKMFGTWLQRSLKLGERMKMRSDLRRRMQLEGGLCAGPQFSQHATWLARCGNHLNPGVIRTQLLF